MGFLERLIIHHKKNAKRSLNFDFFNGCMAAAAYTTVIDGKVDAREDAMLRTLLMTLEQFKLYDKRHGNEIYESFKIDLLKDMDVGHARVVKAIALIRKDREWSLLLGATMQTISMADDEFHESEKRAFAEIMAILDVDEDVIRAFDIEIQDARFD